MTGGQTLYPLHFFLPRDGQDRGGQTWYPKIVFPSEGGPRPGVGQTWYPTKYFPSEGVPRRPGGQTWYPNNFFPSQGGPRPGGRPNLVPPKFFGRPREGQDRGSKLCTQYMFFPPRDGQDRGEPNSVPKNCFSIRERAKTGVGQIWYSQNFFGRPREG